MDMQVQNFDGRQVRFNRVWMEQILLQISVVSLRQIWETVKEQLNELLFIIFNYLRRLDAVDYMNAFRILMRCMESRRELVFTIVEFIAEKLSTQVTSSIAYHH
ncbi:hypothetical protein HF086_011210 [Spodoptera exigua]|uniref:Uncharacterized protein n=1 Tax=Spodoptera exigua TaxID=7107 RepID=A0A922SLG1_SPOEX|nr:hypothetical protein HF086_011210 [Spodoptera exigua]